MRAARMVVRLGPITIVTPSSEIAVFVAGLVVDVPRPLMIRMRLPRRGSTVRVVRLLEVVVCADTGAVTTGCDTAAGAEFPDAVAAARAETLRVASVIVPWRTPAEWD